MKEENITEEIGETQLSSLEKYIDYYGRLDSPGYAVLVTGEWGAGKTYQVIEAVKKLKFKHHHVSLYGIETVDDIHKEVLSAGFLGGVGAKDGSVRQISNSIGKISDKGGAFGGAAEFFSLVAKEVSKNS